MWLEREAKNPIYRSYVYEDADRLEELRIITQKRIENNKQQ